MYQKNNKLYVVLLFSSAYLYKQAFSIPGSVLLVSISVTLHIFAPAYLIPILKEYNYSIWLLPPAHCTWTIYNLEIIIIKYVLLYAIFLKLFFRMF